MSFYTYMLRCSDGGLYVGHTDDLELRIAQHESGEFECWTKSRRPVVLIWSQHFATRLEALSIERRIKKWNRAKKLALANGDFAAIAALGSRSRRSIQGKYAEQASEVLNEDPVDRQT